MKFGEIHRRATETVNTTNDGTTGYMLAQLTTIVQIRIKNKEAYQSHDKKLADWQANVEESIEQHLDKLEEQS